MNRVEEGISVSLMYGASGLPTMYFVVSPFTCGSVGAERLVLEHDEHDRCVGDRASGDGETGHRQGGTEREGHAACDG